MRAVVVDVGNTAIKVGFFNEAGTLAEVRRATTPAELHPWLAALAPAVALVASVAAPAEEVAAELGLLADPGHLLTWSPALRLPIRLHYQTPHTLGADRVGGAAGAAALFPKADVLVLDAGTCLKADVVTADGTFRGGSISPGLRMRFAALATFTDRLPLLETSSAEASAAWPGDSTQHAIRAGVELGYVAEAADFVRRAQAVHPAARVIVTGGDAAWLQARLPAVGRTFVHEPNLVLLGLHRILLCNLT